MMEILQYLKNFSIGFFTGYLFALIFIYLLHWAKAGFDYAEIHVHGILMGILFGWIAGLVNGAICIQKLDFYRILIGLFSGTAVFYIFLSVYT